MRTMKSRLLQALGDVRGKLYATVNVELKDETRTYRQVADANGISLATVQRIAERSGISRQVGPRPRVSDRLEAQDNDKR